MIEQSGGQIIMLPVTLAIDIGGTRLKAGLLDASGKMLSEPQRVDTPHPTHPDDVIDLLVGLASRLGPFDRVSVGFPGVVRHGVVLTAPNLGTELWHGCKLASWLAARFERPVRLLNDATVQGLGVISGRGVECVITLGTGMGFALYHDGRLAPQLELSQHPVRKEKNYDMYVGNAAFQKVGKARWNRRVQRAIGYIHVLTTYDTLYIGGGNAQSITFELPERVQIVSNDAGITGGIRLWDARLDPFFAEPPEHERMSAL
jgi:polyphosphate glucokinase